MRSNFSCNYVICQAAITAIIVARFSSGGSNDNGCVVVLWWKMDDNIEVDFFETFCAEICRCHSLTSFVGSQPTLITFFPFLWFNLTLSRCEEANRTEHIFVKVSPFLLRFSFGVVLKVVEIVVDEIFDFFRSSILSSRFQLNERRECVQKERSSD